MKRFLHRTFSGAPLERAALLDRHHLAELRPVVRPARDGWLADRQVDLLPVS
ncbi:hypothetical protein [Mesorhizobium sp.]|uniref:hypothetical protein n=1 Tax=Mesorhizobium TaxID=68287 RepID=UPI002579DF65|nr:hypothetical protein [Mesorhizobium sp.]